MEHKLREYQDLFPRKAFAHLATLMPDGSPQVTPVWIDYDGEHLLVNTAIGRQKYCNVKRDPRVSVEIMDPEDPYRYVEIRGIVEVITTEGAEDHIDKLANKYRGLERYPWRRPGEMRVLLKIRPAVMPK
jgi:PPOX class probable F420-dependent enzyme